MKHLSLFFLVFVLFGVSVSAQSADTKSHHLSLGTSLGLLSGEGEEIVYRDEGSRTKLSQLLWEFKPLVYYGLEANYNWQRPQTKWGVFADASFKYGFPGETGVMEDRDWMALYYPDFLTHYSVHDNKTDDALLFDANVGFSFRIFEKYVLKPSIAYSFARFSWTASGGSFLYYNDYGYYPNSIDVITYRQTWHIVSPAIAFYGEFNRYFDIELSLKLSPFVWFSGRDHHILRNLVITENLSGGFFIEPGLCFSFKPGKLVTISLSASYRNISGTRGDGKYDYDEQEPYSDGTYGDMKGAGYSAFDAGITVKFHL